MSLRNRIIQWLGGVTAEERDAAVEHLRAACERFAVKMVEPEPLKKHMLRRQFVGNKRMFSEDEHLYVLRSNTVVDGLRVGDISVAPWCRKTVIVSCSGYQGVDR